jgi:hypothetical protein
MAANTDNYGSNIALLLRVYDLTVAAMAITAVGLLAVVFLLH